MNTKKKNRHKRQPPLIFAGFLLGHGLDRVLRFAAPRTAHRRCMPQWYRALKILRTILPSRYADSWLSSTKLKVAIRPALVSCILSSKSRLYKESVELRASPGKYS